jgi:hypothetical protein
MRNTCASTRIVSTLLLVIVLTAQTAAAQGVMQPDGSPPLPVAPAEPTQGIGTTTVDIHAVIALPLATVLGAMLALRPRRKGTPKRSSHVVQTQIILSIIGALVMLVVGNSLARAFGVVGAAGLVRYRARIDDPKDAGVMLSTLAVGLACGVGVYGLAVFASAFIVGALWIIESFEPLARKPFIVEVKSKNAAKLNEKVQALLKRRRIRYELRESKSDEFSYRVELTMEMKTDTLSAEIIALDPDSETGVEWKVEKEKKS